MDFDSKIRIFFSYSICSASYLKLLEQFEQGETIVKLNNKIYNTSTSIK